MKSLLVGDVMTPDPITVTPEVSVTEVARIMVENSIGGVPVVDSSNRLEGIITESDLIVQDTDVEFPSFVHFLTGYVFVPGSLQRFEEEFRRAVANTAGDVMTKKLITVEVDDTVEKVATMMSRKKMKRFPVLKDDKLVGIITMADVVRLISEDIPIDGGGEK